jgi:hypothetical protein
MYKSTCPALVFNRKYFFLSLFPCAILTTHLRFRCHLVSGYVVMVRVFFAINLVFTFMQIKKWNNGPKCVKS